MNGKYYYCPFTNIEYLQALYVEHFIELIALNNGKINFEFFNWFFVRFVLQSVLLENRIILDAREIKLVRLVVVVCRSYCNGIIYFDLNSLGKLIHLKRNF
jgi:hypothetical protein